MRPRRGLVAETLPSSFVDGPGHRAVVFLQGCTFDCINCHNPSTINVCDACGICLDACEPGALVATAAGIAFDPARCTRCNACLAICPSASNPMVAERTVDELLTALRPTAPFLSGVTVTGGEPTMQLDFLVELFEGIRADHELRGLTTFVDSNGDLDTAGWDRLAPVLDGAMIDLKAATPGLHRFLTGHDNGRVLASIAHLHELGLLHEVRLLVIEGATDLPEELSAFAGAIGAVDRSIRVRLMAFRHAGTRQAARLLPETTPGTIERVAATLREAGLTRVEIPAGSLAG